MHAISSQQAAMPSTTGAASSFFLQHKELFEFSKYIGNGPITASSPSFLERYRECERQQTAETMAQSLSSQQGALRLMSTTLGLSSALSMPQHSSGPPYVAADRYYHSAQKPSLPSPPPVRSMAVDPHTISVAHNQVSSYDQHDHHVQRQQPRSPQRRLPSPQRSILATEPSSSNGLPKLTDLLIDASSRAALWGAGKAKVDDAKKIELLIGSKCVGRISVASSSHLPPAIRRRLEASADSSRRRENLYGLLKADYDQLIAE